MKYLKSFSTNNDFETYRNSGEFLAPNVSFVNNELVRYEDKYKITVHYKYADNTQAAADKIEMVKYNTQYSIPSPSITGYTPNFQVISGTASRNNLSFDVMYTGSQTTPIDDLDGGDIIP